MRTLTVPKAVLGGASNNSVQSCTDTCFSSGYPLAGAEYSHECCTYYLSSLFVALVHSAWFLKTAIPTSLMAALRQPQMIAPWSALEIAPSSVVVQTDLMCTTIPVPTFPLGIEAATMGRQFSPSLPISKWDGHTTPAGCKLPVLYAQCKIFDKTGKIFRDNAHGRVFQTEIPDNQTLTVEGCIASCSSQNFSLAGLEYSVQCCKFIVDVDIDRPQVNDPLITFYSLR